MSLLMKVALDADDGKWVTINGSHIHLNEKGEPDKGNPKVIKGMKKDGSGSGKGGGSIVPAGIRFKRDFLDYEKRIAEAKSLKGDERRIALNNLKNEITWDLPRLERGKDGKHNNEQEQLAKKLIAMCRTSGRPDSGSLYD